MAKTDILTKNGLCALLKQYPNMPIFLLHKTVCGRPYIQEGFYNPTTMHVDVAFRVKDTTNYKPCLILI